MRVNLGGENKKASRFDWRRYKKHFLYYTSGARRLCFIFAPGKCFIAEQSGLPRRNEMKTGAVSAVFALLHRSKQAKRLHKRLQGATSSAVAQGYSGTSKQGCRSITLFLSQKTLTDFTASRLVTGLFAEGNDQSVIFVVNGNAGRQGIHKSLLQNVVRQSSIKMQMPLRLHRIHYNIKKILELFNS